MGQTKKPTASDTPDPLPYPVIRLAHDTPSIFASDLTRRLADALTPTPATKSPSWVNALNRAHYRLEAFARQNHLNLDEAIELQMAQQFCKIFGVALSVDDEKKSASADTRSSSPDPLEVGRYALRLKGGGVNNFLAGTAKHFGYKGTAYVKRCVDKVLDIGRDADGADCQHTNLGWPSAPAAAKRRPRRS